jgi:hypothetical protein
MRLCSNSGAFGGSSYLLDRRSLVPEESNPSLILCAMNFRRREKIGQIHPCARSARSQRGKLLHTSKNVDPYISCWSEISLLRRTQNACILEVPQAHVGCCWPGLKTRTCLWTGRFARTPRTR